jgi:hypothetical protein
MILSIHKHVHVSNPLMHIRDLVQFALHSHFRDYVKIMPNVHTVSLHVR